MNEAIFGITFCYINSARGNPTEFCAGKFAH